MNISDQNIHQLQQEILSWYAVNKRDLPWRHTREPYNILLSEIMSQQTQLARVIPKYNHWISVLPTVTSLSLAPTSTVLSLWSGLGYNRRALFLQKAAQVIVSQFNGQFPDDPKILQTLPGIGEYTSRAVACFAFDKQISVIDTNVRKVIAIKLFKGILPDGKVIQEVADCLLPAGRAYAWNQALMDYSAAMLKKEKIPVPKQSAFATSDRRFRGQIMKYLTRHHSIPLKDLGLVLHDATGVALDTDRLEKIVRGLVRDKLVMQDETSITFPE